MSVIMDDIYSWYRFHYPPCSPASFQLIVYSPKLPPKSLIAINKAMVRGSIFAGQSRPLLIRSGRMNSQLMINRIPSDIEGNFNEERQAVKQYVFFPNRYRQELVKLATWHYSDFRFSSAIYLVFDQPVDGCYVCSSATTFPIDVNNRHQNLALKRFRSVAIEMRNNLRIYQYLTLFCEAQKASPFLSSKINQFIRVFGLIRRKVHWSVFVSEKNGNVSFSDWRQKY